MMRICHASFQHVCIELSVRTVQVRQKQAKMGKSLSKNLDRLSNPSDSSGRESRSRKGLSKLFSGFRTTGSSA